MKTLDFASFADNEAVVNSSTIPASSLEMPKDLIVSITAFLIGAIIFDFPQPTNIMYRTLSFTL